MIAPVPVRVRRHPEATRVLVLGLAGLAVCPFLAPLALKQGNRVLAEIDATDAPDGSGVRTVNRASAFVGQRCALVGTVLWGLAAVVLVVLALIAVADAISG